MHKILLAALSLVLFAGCDYQPSADEVQNSKQEQLTRQGVQTVGMPGITNFAEKKLMKMILEQRDKMVPTYTYILDLNGHTHLLCNSLGFGLPGGTQYTNPSKIDGLSSSYVAMPQADPNGLYSPATSDGTYVACIDPKTKVMSPTYIEPHVIVSRFPISL